MVNFDGGVKKIIGGMDSSKEITDLSTPLTSPVAHLNTGGRLSHGMVKLTPTPIRAGLDSATWLQTVISPLPSKPSPELEKFLQLGSGNLVNWVISTANIILEALFPSRQKLVNWSLLNVNLMDNLWTGPESKEAMKLYFKVLESICTSEAQKLLIEGRDLSGLLTNENFHRCMIACAAELISVAHIKVSVVLTVVMQRTGITAFDMSKVIESFIKHEDSLPRELKRHLNSLEEKLLESMVWEKGSSLYNALILARPSLSDEIMRLNLLAEPMPALDEIAMSNHVTSGGLLHQKILKLSAGAKRTCDEYGNKLLKHDYPALDSHKMPPLPPSSSPSLQTAFVSPTQSNSPNKGSTHVDAAISLLFNKMCKLAAVRINSMAERLKLTPLIREKIYLLFQRILTQKTYLFFNRRIEQIILCCFYLAVRKFSQLQLTFQEIKQKYVKETQCRPQDFCEVFVSWSSLCNKENGENRIGIIKFYKDIFLPNVKSLLEDIESKQVPEANSENSDHSPSSPRPSLFPSVPDISPKKVSPLREVYRSPLHPSKKKALNSNVGKSYYALIGQSSSEYQSPSKELDTINECLKRTSLNTARKRRRMLNFDDPYVTLISDAVVAMSLFPENDNCS